MKINIFYSFCILLFLTLFCQTTFSQSENQLSKKGLSNVDLKKACDGYIKMMETETYILHQKKTKEFAEKMNQTLTSAPLDITNKDFFYKWLEENITKTKFKSVEEAKVYIDDMVSTSDKMEKENEVLYNLIKRATIEQIREIRMPFTNHRNFKRN